MPKIRIKILRPNRSRRSGIIRFRGRPSTAFLLAFMPIKRKGMLRGKERTGSSIPALSVLAAMLEEMVNTKEIPVPTNKATKQKSRALSAMLPWMIKKMMKERRVYKNIIRKAVISLAARKVSGLTSCCQYAKLPFLRPMKDLLMPCKVVNTTTIQKRAENKGLSIPGMAKNVINTAEKI